VQTLNTREVVRIKTIVAGRPVRLRKWLSIIIQIHW